jgi:hypothetical protein
VVTGTVAALEAAHRRILQHNLTLGWWGVPFGVVWTPASLRNRRALAALRALDGAAG